MEINPRTQFALPNYPKILLLANSLDADGQPIGNTDAGRTWHTDLSYTATPPRGSQRYAVEVPCHAHGAALGEALFVSTAAANDALPAVRQQTLLDIDTKELPDYTRSRRSEKAATLASDHPGDRRCRTPQVLPAPCPGKAASSDTLSPAVGVFRAVITPPASRWAAL